ncbi:MAG: PAS domain-containing sensor histidine kinase [Methanoregula sp.]|nr:PAS domain-containing sensor histidine kinase [Methanoregula sp.]
MVDIPRLRCRIPLERDDMVRCCVIAALVVLCIITMIVSFEDNVEILSTQLFFIPIIYSAYAFPRRGIIVSGICAVVYELTGYLFRYPDTVGLLAITIQSAIFIGVASLVSYLINNVRAGEAQYRSVFEHSQLGIVLFNRADFRIQRSNQKFSDLLHFTSDELKTKTFPDILNSPTEQDRFFSRINKNTDIDNFETRLKTEQGAACWVNLSWSRLDSQTISCTAVNINARKLAEKAVNDNMTKYRQLTENSPMGILITQSGVIRYANPAISDLLGYPPALLMGKELCTFADEPELVTCSEREHSWEKPRSPKREYEFWFRTQLGGLRRVSLSTTPILHFQKPAALITIIDITEKRELEERIQLDNERRRGIMMTVAHELRTPLQPIMGYLNILLEKPEDFEINDETKKILSRCLSSVDRERQIINRMLDLSVLESGKLTLKCTDFSITNLIRSVIDANGYGSNAAITIDIPSGMIICADRDRLFVVLDALISNAVQYSRPPRIITISYTSGENDPMYHLSVQDNGSGIPENAQKTIFEPFQLADAAQLSRKFDRIGISLAIAKKIMELHRGDITVESAPGAGSTFSIHLPKEGRK